MRATFLVFLLAPCAAHAAAPLTLMAVGDWGGDSDLIPANKAERQAAAGMSKVAAELHASAVLLLGDNFYLHGVSSNESSRFEHTFERVYTPALFPGLPFHVIAGNHDHRGNVQAQIDYRGSARWQFPSLFYKLPFSYTSTTGVNRTLDFIMIDTVTLSGLSDDVCDGCELPGPPSVEAAEEQWQWIGEQLTASKADFLWVAGHYPIYSAGKDGTTSLLVQRLLPLLEQHGAHYISGHDHMHEHISVRGVEMFVTGPGRYCCYPPAKLSTVPEGAIKYMVSGLNGQGPSYGTKPPDEMQSGFSSLELDDTLQLTMYKEDGVALYAAPPIAPRTGFATPRR
jgi:tartrate-resistant acid phosphatase type 5